MARKKRREEQRPYCSAVIVAAGSSERMGEDKLSITLCGESALSMTLRAFEQSPVIDEIVVVTRQEKILPIAELCRSVGITKLSKVVTGGENRTQSSNFGVSECSERAELIAIHDGARPLVTQKVIDSAVTAAAQFGAAAPAVRVKDTVRQARGGVVIKTLEREELYLMQTPQVFRAEMIRACLEDAASLGISLTDDCQAVMLHDHEVHIVEGDYENIKLTTPEDVSAACAIVERRRGW